jgi:predicted nucleic acid-binding protein
LTRVFLDTSALYAVVVVNDVNHGRAAQVFHELARAQSSLITSSYVLVETYA